MQDFFLQHSRQLAATANGSILEGLVDLLKYEQPVRHLAEDAALAKRDNFLALANP